MSSSGKLLLERSVNLLEEVNGGFIFKLSNSYLHCRVRMGWLCPGLVLRGLWGTHAQ